MATAVTGRKRRTVDPARVNDLDAWLLNYKKGYTNLQQRLNDDEGERGGLVVLNTDGTEVVKRIPLQTGFDAIRSLIGNDSGSDSGSGSADTADLREKAAAHLEALTESRYTQQQTHEEAYRVTEKAMLEAVQIWKTAEDAATRAEAAIDVGRLQRDLQGLDAARRQARFPHRFIQSMDLPRKMVNYETRDERILPHVVFLAKAEATVPAERVIGGGTA